MSYYSPSFGQSGGMTRGRGYGGPRGSFRGRGGGSWGGGGSRSFGGSPRFSSPFSSSPYDRKFSSSDRYPPRHSDDYRRSSYRPDSSYSGRDSGRSPDRKRPRPEASSSRHEGYGGYGSSRYESSYSDRRSFSSDRHPAAFPRRSDEFRRPSGPPPSSRGSYRGRISSRGARGLRFRDRPIRRRLLENSYTIRRRIARSSDFARRARMNKLRSVMLAKRGIKKSSSDKEESDTEKDKSENKDENDETVKKEDDGSGKEDAKSDGEEEKKKKKKTFIKLLCPHCGMKALTFFKYERHLSGRSHLIAMRRVAMKQKSILQQMRAAQRSTQNELEKTSEDLATKSQFCPVCKLNYKQNKTVHQATEAHKNMKKFLMPYCKVCSITFKSPMTYEHHLCTIDHMRQKQSVQALNGAADSGEEDNLENFTTIDSIGDNDDGDDDEGKEDTARVNVGLEYISKVESHYCELCKMYLPRTDESDMPKIISRHCKNRVHMQRYIRRKELQDIEKRAAKLQKKETAEKERKEKGKEGENGEAEAESGNKSSDEDEDDGQTNAERYDRFKYSEKNGEELKKGVDGAAVAGGDVKMETEEVKA